MCALLCRATCSGASTGLRAQRLPLFLPLLHNPPCTHLTSLLPGRPPCRGRAAKHSRPTGSDETKGQSGSANAVGGAGAGAGGRPKDVEDELSDMADALMLLHQA